MVEVVDELAWHGICQVVLARVLMLQGQGSDRGELRGHQMEVRDLKYLAMLWGLFSLLLSGLSLDK